MSARALRTAAPIVLDPTKRNYASMRARMRRAEEKYAELLRERGWLVVAPEDVIRHKASNLVDIPLPLEDQ